MFNFQGELKKKIFNLYSQCLEVMDKSWRASSVGQLKGLMRKSIQIQVC